MVLHQPAALDAERLLQVRESGGRILNQLQNPDAGRMAKCLEEFALFYAEAIGGFVALYQSD